jgi:ribosomal peptide maturation radical SAM protein 1
MIPAANAIPDSLPLNSDGEGVALIAMPFILPQFPSLAVGLLRAILAKHAIPCDDYYLNLDFAAQGGVETTMAILAHDADLTGDFVFSGELEPAGGTEEEYIAQVDKRWGGRSDDLPELLSIIRSARRNLVPAFLDWALDAYPWERYAMIGFSSTFQQQAASLAFARRLKARLPHIPLAMGGANLWGEMGRAWLEYAPYLDYVCTGEGDTAFPQLIQALERGETAEGLTNIAWRRGGAVRVGAELPVTVAMDSLPVPNYDTYFERCSALELHRHPVLRELRTVTFEASRGCWWGEKQHCVFCGLNNSGMAYRSKSPERVYDEIKALSGKYHVTSFHAADNILERRYVSTLFRRLEDEGSDLEFFFEIKSNVKLAELRDLRRGGVTELQPGIESLSSELLRLMRKGVSGIQNVFMMKWARYFGISLKWNVLSGFFGERQEHYDQQADWMRRLYHLDPPLGRAEVIVERFSPLFAQPEQFGISNVRADALYHSIYTDADVDLNRIAYYFEHDAVGRLPREALADIDSVIAEWQAVQERRPSLTSAWSPGGFLRIVDRRFAGVEDQAFLETPQAEIFEMAGLNPATPTGLAKELAERLDAAPSAEEVREHLEAFVGQGWAIREGDRYLTLALPVSRRHFDRPQESSSKAAHGSGQAQAESTIALGILSI